MKERPILMSAPMVRAILEGRKTQTRRVYKPREVDNVEDPHGALFAFPTPYGSPGDRLWVRETWSHDAHDLDTCRAAHEDASPGIGYGPYYRSTEVAPDTLRWKPSIFMPRWASRITLEVTEVRVQRLQEISEDDAKAEGCEPSGSAGFATARGLYAALWDSINGARAPWPSNPWVWAITFRRLP